MVTAMPRLSEQVRHRLREQMSVLDMSQRDVAGILGWSQSRVAHLLTGRVEMSIDDLAEFASAVNLRATEAVRDRGMEFCAEMTPTELRLLELLRKAGDADRDAILQLLGGKSAKARLEERRASPVQKRTRKSSS